MTTLGVDVASQPRRTATCLIRWGNGSAVVDSLSQGSTDSDLLEMFGKADKIGIDAPFGWPVNFVQAIGLHSASTVWPVVADSHLRFRQTDRVVKQRVGRWPLMVAADRIAIPAMRVARLLAEVSMTGEVVDRGGGGRFVETYPAAALSIWGLPSRGYKGKKAAAVALRTDMVGRLATKAGAGLKLTREDRRKCRDSDDMLDALVAAIVTRAAAIGYCEPIPDEDRRLAKREGWIALPESDSLRKLV